MIIRALKGAFVGIACVLAIVILAVGIGWVVKSFGPIGLVSLFLVAGGIIGAIEGTR